jgi:hypothetical protein
MRFITKTHRSPIGGLLFALIGVGVLLAAPSAHATRTIAGTWQNTYPASLSYANSGCVLCHNTPSGTGGFNPYGVDVFLEGIAGAEGINSDGDPGSCTNLDEINASTQPAWTPPLPDYIDPSWITGLLDPADPCGGNFPPDVINPGDQLDAENTAVSLQIDATDADGDDLSYSALGLPPGLGINATSGLISGTVSFTAVTHPDLTIDYNVEVTVDDGTDPTIVGFVWTVDDVNRDPIALDDSDTTTPNTAVNVDVLANDSDPDPEDVVTVDSVGNPSNGSAANNGDSVTYTPDTDFTGTDTFSYTITDGFGGSATATVTVTVEGQIGGPDVTNPGPQQNTETDTVSLQIVAIDPDDDPLTYSIVAPDILPPDLTIDPNTGLISGTVSYDAVIHPDTQLSYTVTVEVSDGINPAVPVTFGWTIDDLNRDPVAVDDSDTTPRDTAVTISVLDNDSDADGDTLSIPNNGLTNPQNGTVATDGTTVTYTPDALFVGTDSFDYTVEDGFGGSATATVTVVVSEGEAPIAVDDVYSTAFETSLTVPAPGVLANDSDPDGDALIAVQQTDPSNGTATLDADGSFTYTPNGGFSGPDSFTYVANDGFLDSNVATVTINVDEPPPGNECPVVDNPGDQTNDETDEVSLQIDASDPDGDTLSYSATGLPPILMIDASTGEIMNVVSYEAVQHPDLEAVYTVTVAVSDGDPACDQDPISSVSFDWTVNDVNRDPVAVDDNATTDLNTPVTVDVLANDDDPDGDELTVAGVGEPLNGTAEVNNDGTVTYTPNTGFLGEDDFVYTIEDGFGGTGQATVTIMVVDPGTGEDPDVFLTRVRAPSVLNLRTDRETERTITVFGGGDTIEQEATVTLVGTWDGDGLEVEIEPESVTETVVPGRRETRFSFEVELECERSGSYEVTWTAIIDADENSDPTNDTAVAETDVECRGRGQGGKKRGHDDD